MSTASKLSRIGTKMAKFERVNFLRASLSPEEVHLSSFKGSLCGWDQGQFSNEEIPILIEGAAFLGHVTNARLIIEQSEAVSLPTVLGGLDPKLLERIVLDLPCEETMQHMADQIGYLSFDFADMDHLGVYRTSACWPVMKYNMNGRDPAFLPHTLFRITAYTGAIVGPPAPIEFAEVIRDRGIRIVTYTSKAS
jgi:hypothetical protein